MSRLGTRIDEPPDFCSERRAATISALSRSQPRLLSDTGATLAIGTPVLRLARGRRDRRNRTACSSARPARTLSTARPQEQVSTVPPTPLWLRNDLGSHAAVRPDYRNDGGAGVSLARRAPLLLATSRTLRLPLRWQEVDQRSRAAVLARVDAIPHSQFGTVRLSSAAAIPAELCKATLHNGRPHLVERVCSWPGGRPGQSSRFRHSPAVWPSPATSRAGRRTSQAEARQRLRSAGSPWP